MTRGNQVPTQAEVERARPHGDRARVTIAVEVQRNTPGPVNGSEVEHALRRYIRAKSVLWAGPLDRQTAYRVLSVDSSTESRPA